MRTVYICFALAFLSFLNIPLSGFAFAQNRSVTYDAASAQWETVTLYSVADGGVNVIGCGSIGLSDGTTQRKCSDNISRNQLSATTDKLGNGLVRRAFIVGDGGL